MTRGAVPGSAFREMPTRRLTSKAMNNGAGRCVMRAPRTYGAALALWLLASLGGHAGISPRVAAAQETPEGLRQGLIQVADLIGGMSPEAAGEAASLRTTLTEADPDVLAAMQAELSRRPAWKGTGHLLQTLAPIANFRAATAARPLPSIAATPRSSARTRAHSAPPDRRRTWKLTSVSSSRRKRSSSSRSAWKRHAGPSQRSSRKSVLPSVSPQAPRTWLFGC